MPGESVVTTLTQKWAVFPAFSSREVTSGQMRKIVIHFIIYLSGRMDCDVIDVNSAPDETAK